MAAPPTAGTVRVVVIGCGVPNKSMGWYHITQLVDNPRVRIAAVVEPWFLGAGGEERPGVEAFARFRGEVCAAHPEALFVGGVADLPQLRESDDGPVLALIAVRTKDAPTIFEEICGKGVTHIYLEKPGAETSEQLQRMTAKATDVGVSVVIGYNKNVSAYVRDAMKAVGEEAARPLPLVCFEHNNALAPGDEFLNFIRGPGAEGMLHNMMCHELALLVTFFGVRFERIASVTMDADRCELVDLGGGAKDWKRVCFRLQLQENGVPLPASVIEVAADRCAGSFSQVHLGEPGDARRSFRVPDEAHEAWVAQKMREQPEVMPYLFLQDPDYRTLKDKLFDHILAGSPGGPEGIVTLEGANDVLRLADMLKPILFATLEAGPPYAWTAVVPS